MAKVKPTEAEALQATLDQRGSRYGKFADNSRVFHEFMTMVANSPVGLEKRITPTQHHALSNIGTKIARILTGDPNYDDNWRDIAGYATIMVDICNGKDR